MPLQIFDLPYETIGEQFDYPVLTTPHDSGRSEQRRLKDENKNPLQLDSKAPTTDFEEFAYSETRYRSLRQSKPEVAAQLMKLAKQDVVARFSLMEQLANLKCPDQQESSE